MLKNFFSSKPSDSADPPPLVRESAIRLPAQKDGGVIIWFSGLSQGDALAAATREHLAPFAKLASGIIQIDPARPEWLSDLQQALSNPVWFAVSFFGVGQDVSLSDGPTPANLWEQAGIPFVRFYGDIPAYFPDRHVRQFRNSINAYWHPSHAAFYRRWFPDPGLSVLLPPIPLETIPLESVDAARKLTGKIIFPKNGNPPAGLQQYWQSALPKTVSRILMSAAEELSANGRLDGEPQIDDILKTRFSEVGIDLSGEPALLCFLVAQLDDYLRRVKSTMIVEALLDLPVIIRGASWEHVSFRGKRAAYDPDFDYVRTRSLIDAAPAVVDMSPNTTHTPHDRVLRAIGRGTAFLTNGNDTLRNLLPAERYSFEFEKDSIGDLVEFYASHPQQAVDLGLEQARVLREAFKPENYVTCLIAAVDAVSLGVGSRPEGTQNFVIYPPEIFR
jgi:hypothetical protein